MKWIDYLVLAGRDWSLGSVPRSWIETIGRTTTTIKDATETWAGKVAAIPVDQGWSCQLFW